MYHRSDPQLSLFELPFGENLCPENRWVQLSNLIPWEEFIYSYQEQFSPNMGAPSKPVRMALGALLIKEKLGVSDEETVEQIKENPYLQYFIGLKQFTNDAPFDPSMMVHFRKRFSLKDLQEINEKIVSAQSDRDDKDSDSDSDSDSSSSAPDNSSKAEPPSDKGNQNSGKLLIDATCAPADIRFPTDLGTLNEGREKLEKIIDELHGPLIGKEVKPRTYRKKARKQFLKTAKRKKVSFKQRRRAVRQQLGFVNRNLQIIEQMLEKGAVLSSLSRRNYQNLLVVSEVYRQQQQMYDERVKRIDGRIVSISQPHVRPIVRGKAGRPTEFGAKLSASVVDGFSFVDHLSWDSFNESQDFVTQVELYRDRFGVYPESVHVDKIYRTKANRKWAKDRGIRMSGPPLGRPPKEVSAESRVQAYQDEVIRNAIEGKFGQAKRRFGLGRVMAKLSNTSETAIAITFLVMNLEKCLAVIFYYFFSIIAAIATWIGKSIAKLNSENLNTKYYQNITFQFQTF